jgi:hypothetical protein
VLGGHKPSAIPWGFGDPLVCLAGDGRKTVLLALLTQNTGTVVYLPAILQYNTVQNSTTLYAFLSRIWNSAE